MAPLNILHQMQKISKTLWTLWQGIYSIKRWTLPRQMTLRILMALAILSRTLSYWCIRLTGTLFILIIRPWLLGQKSRPNLLQKLLRTLAKATRKSLNMFWWLLKVPPPPIPAKSKKEVNVISKYFQSNKPSTKPMKLTMSYAQASKQTANTSKVLKIKEAFSALNVKKIDQINNIIKGNLKPKPCI